MESTSKLTEQYIEQRRTIKDCLRDGLINYSSLARQIAKDLKLEKKASMEAILIAARRYAMKLKKQVNREKQIMKLIEDGEIEIKNRIIVAVLDRYTYKAKLREMQKKVESVADVFHTVEGSKTTTIVTHEKYLADIKSIFKSNVLKVNKDLVEIVIKSPPEIESVPGVVSHIAYLFAEHDVNIVELTSCWTDTMIVISKKDLQKAMEFLRI